MTAAHCELSLHDQCAETALGACAPSSDASSPPQPIAMTEKLRIKSTLRFIATPSELSSFGKTSVAEGIASAYHLIKGLLKRTISLGWVEGGSLSGS